MMYRFIRLMFAHVIKRDEIHVTRHKLECSLYKFSAASISQVCKYIAINFVERCFLISSNCETNRVTKYKGY